ncbi:MAG TPA: AMP-binding protein [Longimicrobiales bacterium]
MSDIRSGTGNVAGMLWSAAERSPGKAAVIERDQTATYAEVRERASGIAASLVALGVNPGDRVCLFLERGIEAVAAWFGVQACGAIIVVLNETLRPRQVEYAVSHSGASVVISSAALLQRQHRKVETAAAFLLVESIPSGSFASPVDRSAGDAAQITYTSGSTGMPKGVVGTHGNIWSVISTVATYLGLRASDRLAGVLPISGVYGANQMLCATLVEGTFIVPKSPLMNQVASELRQAEATVLAAVPPLWVQLLAAPGFAAEPIPSLRILQNAGGHLPPAVAQQIRQAQPQARLFLQYGMTEVFRSTYLSPDDLDARPGSMGRPIDGCEILVVREDNTLCEVDEVGELVHCGPTVTQGYWNDPDRTAEVFRTHPVDSTKTAVYSGDMVRRDRDGFLYFVARRDRMIKTLGYRVGPDEILDVLYASKHITEGVVTSADDADRGQRIVAYVVLAPGSSLKDVTNFCRAELPRYMQPAEIVAVDDLPRLPNGKHDVAALRKRAGASS